MPVETKISFSDGSSDTTRKLSDDLSRKHLSDHSVVLTEDTDSFIIGERVWVGGTKPGQIAYIGETQFAPGEWAGIVLDEPIGKNDGSVAGVRYFQCSEKRGVFSRLTRLTRVPLLHAPHDASPVSDASSVFERPPSARNRRTLSPNGSVRSIMSSKMNASISTTNSGDLRMGDRVIVSSSRGSKAGTLRYVGITDFASGIWAGVELDDPLGKNDGSVEGKRYFECAPRFGLFAPISKVSRSPSNRKPGMCAIHSNGRATPLRRSNSRESLTSLGTSIASSRAGVRLGVTSLSAQRVGGPRASSTPVSAKNALQELLREKQHHLERLMRERELERAEVAKVSLQADRAETALEQLKKETTQTNTENEKLKAELHRLNKQLEDEKQKVEDLMFRNEEENINKEDYNKYREAMEQEKAVHEARIRELEAEAALQRERADAAGATLLAVEEQHAAEAAALADQQREELAAAHTLSSELQKLLDEAYALLKEKENEKDSLGKSMSEELTKVKADSEKALNEAKTKMAIAQTEFETQLSVVTAKLQLSESKLENEKQNLERLNKENSQVVIDLNTKLTQFQAALDDKTHELNKVMSVQKEHEVVLNKEITKLKMELSAKILDLEQLDDKKRKNEAMCKTLQDEITQVKEEYGNKFNEYESLLSEAVQQNEKYKSEVVELQHSLSTKTKEFEKLVLESNVTSNSTEKIVNEYKNTILERDKEIIKLKDDFEQASANFNIKHSKIAEEHKKEIDERNSKIDQLIKEIECHKQTLDQTKIEFDTLNSQFTINIDELRILKEENEKLTHTINELRLINNTLKETISKMELEIGELKRQYEGSLEKCTDLQKAKEKAESEYLNLTGQATDSNEQFNKLSQHLKETESELQVMKDKQRETINNHSRIEQELKQKLFKIQEDYSLERGQFVRSIDEHIEKYKVAESKTTQLEAQIAEMLLRLKKIETDNDKLMDENSILKQEIEVLRVKEQELIHEHESACKKLQVEIDKYREEISILKADGVSSEVKLMEKVDQLTEAQNDLNNKLEEARKHEDSLQKIVDDMTSQLNNKKINFEKEIARIQAQSTTVSEELNKLKVEEVRLTELLQEKENKLKDLTLKLEMLEVDLKSNLEIIAEKDRQSTQLQENLDKVMENKKISDEKLNNIAIELSTVNQKYENLLSSSTAEESLMKDQLGQVEALQKEIVLLVQDKKMLETKYKEVSDELQKLKLEHVENTTKLKENIEFSSDIKKTLEEKECLLKSQKEQSQIDSNNIGQLEKEISELKKELLNKDNLLQEKESQLINLNENLFSRTSENQKMLSQLQNQNVESNSKYLNEIESLNNTTKTLQNRVNEQEQQLDELKHTKEKVIELQKLLDKSDSDIKQLTNINDAQKTNYEELNKQLQTQYDNYKKETKQINHDLKNKLEQYKKDLHDSKDLIKVEIEKQVQLQEKLTEAEKTILELSNKIELVTVQQTDDAEKDERLEKLTIEIQAIRKSSAEVLAKSEETVNNLKLEAETKIRELKEKDNLITKLQEDLKSQKAKVEIAERQKALLEKEISSRGVQIRDNNDNNAVNLLHSNNAVHKQKLIEDREMIDGQVSFLNSVIVDMQRKNEKLMARVQALEGGTVDEPPIFNGRKARAVAPRLFCDICDVFDAHDTEECPRQAADVDAPAPPPQADGKRAPPPPRPYCDICEVFGHATENCDEEETF